MGRYGRLDYPGLAKAGFLLGVGLFALGAGGEWAIHAAGVGLPAWEDALFFDLEVLGVLVSLFAPLLFGVVMPLTE